MSRGGAIFVPSSTKTGINLRHSRPPQSLNDSSRIGDPARECLFIYDGEVGPPLKAKRHRWEDSWSDGTGAGATRRTRPSKPALRTPSTGVEVTPKRVRGSF